VYELKLIDNNVGKDENIYSVGDRLVEFEEESH
jgi:hypothetical protein